MLKVVTNLLRFFLKNKTNLYLLHISINTTCKQVEIKQILIPYMHTSNEKIIGLKQNREVFWQNIYCVKQNYLITLLSFSGLEWMFQMYRISMDYTKQLLDAVLT